MGYPGFFTPEGWVDTIVVDWPKCNDSMYVQNLYTLARRPVVEGMVNLVEADQIPDSFRGLANVLPLERTAYAWKGFQKALKGLRRASRRFASAYLAYQFGIAPLLSDLKKSKNYLDKIANDFRRFATDSNQHKSIVLSAPMPWSAVTSGSGTVTRTQLRVTFPAQQRYTLTYRYKRFLADTFVDKVQFLALKLGFTDLAEIAWELIPYSFIVDWFVDTSGLLQLIDDSLGLDPIQTISITKSRKWQGEIDVFRDVYGYGTGNLKVAGRKATTSYSYYERWPLGRSNYVGPSNRFGNKQMLLTLALARQRLKS
jgi:hypothetical protein